MSLSLCVISLCLALIYFLLTVSDREVLILENYIKMFYITTEDPVGYICKNTLEALLKAISLFPFSILG